MHHTQLHLFLIKEQHGDYKITDEELENQFFDKFEQMYNNDELLFDETTLRKVTTALNEDAPVTGVSGVPQEVFHLENHQKVW